MKFQALLFSIILFLSVPSFSQGVTLSEEAEIYIMTLGPYQGELYSAFGHSAIHLKDPIKGVDWVYNYGVFDFDQENFYFRAIPSKEDEVHR